MELAKRYGVQAYPTFLYLDAQGYVIDKVVGEQNVQGIIRLAQTALAREGSLLREWEAQYLDGDRDLKFLRKYQELLRSKQLDNTAVLDAYYRLLPQEQLKEEATSIYLSKVMMNTHSVAFVQLMQHYPELSPAARKALAPALFALTVRKGTASALVDGKWVEYAHLRMLGDQLEGLNEKDQEFLLRLDLRYAVQTRSYGVLKRAGYALAEPAFALPESVVQEENVRLYAEAMEPFLSGKRDSTTVVGFAEEQMFARQLKTMEVTEKMHLVAQLFASLPSNETAALKDAVRWIKRCIALYPSNAAFPLVLEKLQAKL